MWSWRLTWLMTFKRAWLESFKKIFILKNRLKNLLIRLYNFSTLFRSVLNKKGVSKVWREISWNSRSGHFKLPFDNTILVNKNMFRSTKTTLKIILTNVCLGYFTVSDYEFIKRRVVLLCENRYCNSLIYIGDLPFNIDCCVK